MAFFVGAILGMALFGALTAWIIRYVHPIPLLWSYALGILIFLFPAAYSYSLNSEGVSFAEGLLIYGVGGALAWPILATTALLSGRDRVQQEDKSPLLLGAFRVMAWIFFALLSAIAATMIFAAFKSETSDATFYFLVGAIMSIGSFFLYRYLSKPKGV